MQVSLNTLVEVSNEVLLEILNVAINGACASWATISERRPQQPSPHYTHCVFTPIADRGAAVVVSVREIAQGIEHALSGKAQTPNDIRRKILRIVADNDVTEVDLAVADHVVRALVHRMEYAIAA